MLGRLPPRDRLDRRRRDQVRVIRGAELRCAGIGRALREQKRRAALGETRRPPRQRRELGQPPAATDALAWFEYEPSCSPVMLRLPANTYAARQSLPSVIRSGSRCRAGSRYRTRRIEVVLHVGRLGIRIRLKCTGVRSLAVTDIECAVRLRTRCRCAAAGRPCPAITSTTIATHTPLVLHDTHRCHDTRSWRTARRHYDNVPYRAPRAPGCDRPRALRAPATGRAWCSTWRGSTPTWPRSPRLRGAPRSHHCSPRSRFRIRSGPCARRRATGRVRRRVARRGRRRDRRCARRERADSIGRRSDRTRGRGRGSLERPADRQLRDQRAGPRGTAPRRDRDPVVDLAHRARSGDRRGARWQRPSQIAVRARRRSRRHARRDPRARAGRAPAAGRPPSPSRRGVRELGRAVRRHRPRGACDRGGRRRVAPVRRSRRCMAGDRRSAARTLLAIRAALPAPLELLIEPGRLVAHGAGFASGQVTVVARVSSAIARCACSIYRGSATCAGASRSGSRRRRGPARPVRCCSPARPATRTT